MCVACRYQRCHQMFGTPKNMSPVIRRLKEQGLMKSSAWSSILKAKKTKLKPHQHYRKRGRPPSKPRNESFEEYKEYEHSPKPTIGKPALWSVATSTSTTTVVKHVPMISAKMVHPSHKGSVRVPCGAIANGSARTAVLRPDDLAHRPGK